MIDDFPLTHYQHRTLDIPGRVWRGGSYRNLIAVNDVLTFDVFRDNDDDLETVRISAYSGSGITQTEQGEFRIILEDHHWDIPAGVYEYSLSIREGDTLRTFTLSEGVFTLKNSPRPLSV